MHNKILPWICVIGILLLLYLWGRDVNAQGYCLDCVEMPIFCDLQEGRRIE